MAGVISNVDGDVQKLRKLKNEIENVRKALMGINITVDIDIVKGLQSQLTSLIGQYDALVDKIAAAEGKIMLSVSRINKTTEKIVQAQEKVSKVVSAPAQIGDANTQTNTAETASIQAQAKAYDDLRTEINDILGTRDANIKRMVEEMNAICLINAEIKKINKSQRESSSLSSAQQKRLEQLNNSLLTHKTVLSEVRQVLNNNAKLDNVAATSMNGLSQSLSRMRTAYRELTEEERNSPLGKELLASIQQADTKIKELDATIGNHQRNVGNYGKQWNGLSMSIQQVGRELPSLAYGPKVFFSAISNNLPILADEIKRARTEYELLKKSGQAATPVWKQVISSLFSWQSALTVGVTLLTLYGDKVVDWVAGLFKAKDALQDVVSYQQNLSKITSEGARNSARERVELDTLYKTTQNHKRALEERNKAADELRKKYPSYFGNLSNEAILAGNAASAYKSLTENLLKAAQARAAMKIIEENYNKIYKLQKAINADTNWTNRNKEKTKGGTSSVTAVIGGSITGYIQTGEVLTDEAIEYNRRTKALQENKKAVDALKDANNTLIDSIDVSAFVADNGNISGVKDINAYTDQLHRITELERKQTFERQRQQQDLDNQLEQSRIDSLQDGYEKEQAQRELMNKKEIQALKRQKEDYIRATIQAEKEKFDAQEDIKAKQIKGYNRKTFDTSSVKVDASKYDKIIENTQTSQGLNEWEQREASMNEYLLKYGTFFQKKEAIDKKYQNAIDKETDLGIKNTLKEEWKEAKSALDMDKLKQEINWELIFGDLSKVSKKSLEQVKNQLKELKNSDEYKNMDVDQKKVIDEALNNIQSTIIDKGGLLGDLPAQLDALRIAQDELKKAQDEYNESLKSGTDAEREAALKKKNNAEKNVQNAETNVTKSADKTKQNLITLADTITQLGSSSEMSLSQIGSLAGGLVDIFAEAGSKIGGIVGATFSLLDGIEKQGLDGFVKNVFSSVFDASRSMWDTITFGAVSKITGFGDSDKTLEKDLEYLTQSNQDLRNSLDNLSEKMDKASVAESNDIYQVQKENLEKQEANLREAMQRSGDASKSGIFSSAHSSNYKINKGISTSEWNKVSEIVGRSVRNAGQFFQLSSEEMAKLADEDTTLYSKIKDLANDGYKDAAQYMDEYITFYKQLEELENAHNEKLTNTSFDSVRDEFKNALFDMESDVEDFTANFEKMMQNAIAESLMTKKYDALIQA